MFILYLHEILLASNAWSMGNETTLRTNACIIFEAGIELMFLYYTVIEFLNNRSRLINNYLDKVK